MDLSFLDKYKEEINNEPKGESMTEFEDLSLEDRIETELTQLSEIGRYIGSYRWQYKGYEDFHDGIVAQELLQVPGLKDAVHKAEDGTLMVDTSFLAMATLGYVAALTRLVAQSLPITSTPEDQVEQDIESNNIETESIETAPILGE